MLDAQHHGQWDKNWKTRHIFHLDHTFSWIHMPGMMHRRYTHWCTVYWNRLWVIWVHTPQTNQYSSMRKNQWLNISIGSMMMMMTIAPFDFVAFHLPNLIESMNTVRIWKENVSQNSNYHNNEIFLLNWSLWPAKNENSKIFKLNIYFFILSCWSFSIHKTQTNTHRHTHILTALYRLTSIYRSVLGTCPRRHTYGRFERMKMHAKLNKIPTKRPISIETMITVRKVPSQTIASKRDNFQNSTHCLTCTSIPLSATTMMLANTHWKSETENRNFNSSISTQMNKK